MQASELVQAVRQVPEAERAVALAQATRELPREGQQVVASQGIDKGVWPQESAHRMFTILGSLLAAVLAGGLAIGASAFGAEGVGAALVALATAIVGGIFGYAQATK